MVDNVKITVEHICGDSRAVADRARTTIGLHEGDKEVTDKYMRRMYLCRHSPIRIQMYKIKFEGIPYCTGMHFARHKHGVEHFFSTQRSDRTGVDRTERRQTDPVLYEMVLNAEAILNISHMRLCSGADKDTIKIWKKVVEELRKINPVLADCCVPRCIREGHCYEFISCGYHKTKVFKEKLEKHREGINE